MIPEKTPFLTKTPSQLFTMQGEEKKECGSPPANGSKWLAATPLKSVHPSAASCDLLLSKCIHWGRRFNSLQLGHKESLGKEFDLLMKTADLFYLKVELQNRCGAALKAFEEKRVCWFSCCEKINELSSLSTALQYLKVKNAAFPEIKKELSSIAALLDENLDRINNKPVREAKELTYAELLKYYEIFQSHLQSDLDRSEPHLRLSAGETGLPYAITIDLKMSSFYLHLNKPHDESRSELLEGKMVYEALLISDKSKKVEVVKEVVVSGMFYSDGEIEAIMRFSHIPSLGNSPIAILRYREHDPLIPSVSPDKVSLLYYPLFGSFREYVGTLPQSSRRESLFPLLLDIAKGLAALHDAGYAHGNISPEALFVRLEKREGSLKAAGIIEGVEKALLVKQKSRRERKGSFNAGHAAKEACSSSKEMEPYLSKKSSLGAAESPIEAGESHLQKRDVWDFGISAWHSLYENVPKELLGEGGVKIGKEAHVYHHFQKNIPHPKSDGEKVVQEAILRCLEVNAKERINSQQLTRMLEKAKKRSSSNAALLRKKSTKLLGPLQHGGNKSMPEEFFHLFLLDGNLQINIGDAAKAIQALQASEPPSLSEIASCENLLRECKSSLEELVNTIGRFYSSYTDTLERHIKNIPEFKLSLDNLQNSLLSLRFSGGGGITYGELCRYRDFAEAKFKKKKKGAPSQPSDIIKSHSICPHYPKESNEGHRHALTLELDSKIIIYVHLKKKGERKSALGKGAEKSVHEALKIDGDTITLVADIAIRMNRANPDKEERYKKFFAKCSYIERAAFAATVYSKSEVEGLWQRKEELSAEEVEKIGAEKEKKSVKKVAFLSHKYFCSLSSISYKLQGERDKALLIDLLQDIANGLMHLHENGVIHRDLKGGNIYVDRVDDGKKILQKAVIGDFGEAYYVGEEGCLPEKSRMAGTLFYNSPEICLPKKNPDYRMQSFASDIWAFGILSFQVLYGTGSIDVPFLKGIEESHIFTVIENLKQQQVDDSLRERFPPPASEGEKRMQKMILCCLRVNPKERPSARELVEGSF